MNNAMNFMLFLAKYEKRVTSVYFQLQCFYTVSQIIHKCSAMVNIVLSIG